MVRFVFGDFDEFKQAEDFIKSFSGSKVIRVDVVPYRHKLLGYGLDAWECRYLVKMETE